MLALASRERARDLLKHAFPRRRGRLALARTVAEFKAAFKKSLIDAAIVDVAHPTEETWKAAALARDYPSVPFFALSPVRVADTAALARCVDEEFADLLVEGMDDGVVRDLVLPQSFTIRFSAALNDACPALGLDHQIQERAWRAIVAHGGRTVRTELIAAQLNVTREHLSRSFAASGSPNLKRIIDLVRLIAAAELAKNPGYDVSEVARVLEFASPSHLTSTSQRIVGTRSASLARLRTGDLIERFRQGRGRSRKS
ncbi:MAG: helix-turn-helix domain-containing protein [Polyangiales bacterium]